MALSLVDLRFASFLESATDAYHGTTNGNAEREIALEKVEHYQLTVTGMKYVEEMSRAEVTDELRIRLDLSESTHLVHWSAPSLKALLVFCRERVEDEQEDRKNPQLGIALALRMSLAIVETPELKN